MIKTFWRLEETNSSHFPYRLKILKGGEVILDLLVPDVWPESKLRRLLEELKARGRVVCEGRGAQAKWHHY